MTVDIEERVARHYARPDLDRIILQALRASGKSIKQLTSSDLAPIDEFHIGGRQATIELAARLEITPDMHILDVGCGLGGAARYLAEAHGCRVTGIDLTVDYVRAAESLTRHVGLSHLVTFRHGSALNLPFSRGTFDGAYMMHVGMNIADKPRLFAEVRRVLRTGGFFAIYDVMLTGVGEVTFPLPCAATAETSFVVGVGEFLRGLEAAGFEVCRARDRLELAREFCRREMARAAADEEPPTFPLDLLLKDDAPRVFANVSSLFERGVLAPTELVCRAM
jgi:SAM-dependent methyltransferase